MEIKASSIYDLKTTKALIRLNMFKKNDPKKQILIYGIIVLVLFVFLIIGLIATGDSSYVGLIFLLALSSSVYSYMYFLFPKTSYKATKKLADVKNSFIFKDDEILLSSNTAEYTGNAAIKYTMLYKVMETSEYLFIYQNKVQVYIVDKSTIENGSVNDLRQVLSNVLKKKYIVCKY